MVLHITQVDVLRNEEEIVFNVSSVVFPVVMPYGLVSGS
jgi:hypothetical protein